MLKNAAARSAATNFTVRLPIKFLTNAVVSRQSMSRIVAAHKVVFSRLMKQTEYAHEPYKFFFETLANEVRWRIVHLLQDEELRATDIAKKLGCEQSLVSHHLKRLLQCGFVSVEPNGNERVYRLNGETIRPILAFADRHIEKFCKKICCCK
jgi:DNA-binding transcriptional ArsR family regulator